MAQAPPTPNDESGFDSEWVQAVTRDYLAKLDSDEQDSDDGETSPDPDKIKVTKVVKAVKNEVQGILSTTYVVDFEYQILDGNDGCETKDKSIFVKIPLKG